MIVPHNTLTSSTSREFLLAELEIPVTAPCEADAYLQLNGQFQKQLKCYQGLASVRTAVGKTEQMILAIGLNQNPESDTAPPFIEVAQCIDQLATECKGFWTFDPSALFLMILPATGSDTQTVAQLCQQRITLFAKQIVTLGITFSPAGENQPADVVSNAKKAARHASFLGPGASVVFDAVSLNISGDDFYRQGQIHPAIHEFEAGLRMDPQNTNLINSLGVCHAVSGDYPKARKAFQEVIVLDPNEVMAVYNLGLVMLLTGKREDALARFEAAESMDDSIFEIHFQKAKIYREQGQSDQTVTSLNRAIAIKPDAAAACRMLGDEMADQEKFIAAKRYYTQALRHRPNDAKALSALGALYGKLNENLDLAELYLTQSVAIDPKDGNLFLALGAFYKKIHRMKKAARAFQKAYALGMEKGRDEADQIRALEPETDKSLQTITS